MCWRENREEPGDRDQSEGTQCLLPGAPPAGGGVSAEACTEHHGRDSSVSGHRLGSGPQPVLTHSTVTLPFAGEQGRP